VTEASSAQDQANWTQLALGWRAYFSFGMVATGLVLIITLIRKDLSRWGSFRRCAFAPDCREGLEGRVLPCVLSSSAPSPDSIAQDPS
jgi:hypothetical protein